MSIWAIADIHASRVDPETGRPDKPMDVFGERWTDHIGQLERHWRGTVEPGDTVIVAGDIDWAMYLPDAVDTLEWLASLPGSKILVRGNHDYWWSSKNTNKVRRILPDSVALLHNEALVAEGVNICGAKGSPVPGAIDWTPDDEKILRREVQRLATSLGLRDPALPTVAALHYPPFYPAQGRSLFQALLEDNSAAVCVYGHLHGEAAAMGPRGLHNGVTYCLVAGDAVGFQPVLIARDGKVAPPAAIEYAG